MQAIAHDGKLDREDVAFLAVRIVARGLVHGGYFGVMVDLVLRAV